MALEKVDLPVLVIGYKRVNTLRIILEKCLKNSNSVIFVSMDGVSGETNQFENAARDLVRHLHRENPDRFRIRLHDRNLGSAVNVISSLDWFFSEVDRGVILEDDCIPEDTFFEYALSALSFIESESRIWFCSGYRPEIKLLEEMNYSLCSLPMNWGWGTTSRKWSEIRNLLDLEINEGLITSFFKGPSRVYWNIGHRRIQNGWVDAWDTSVAFLMNLANRSTLLPNLNLINNVGNDEHASNTKHASNFLNSKTYIWNQKRIVIDYKEIESIDRVINQDMVGIRRRHQIIPIIKFVTQKFFGLHKNLGKLNSRLDEVKQVELFNL